MAKKYPYNPDYAVPPGRTLHETLAEKGVDAAAMADLTGLSIQLIEQMLTGEAEIGYNIAQRLERATGVPAKLWAKLEINYRAQLKKLGADQA